MEYLARIWGTVAPVIQWDDSGNSFIGKGKDRREANSANLSALLGESPTILTMSLSKNIQPTVDFYCRAGYISLDDEGRLDCKSLDGKVQVIRGRYIAASLFNRLLPRWQYYCSKQEDETDSALLSSTFPRIPLHVLAGTTDEVFCQHLGFDLEEYSQFKKESIPNLKFSSQFDAWLTSGIPFDV